MSFVSFSSVTFFVSCCFDVLTQYVLPRKINNVILSSDYLRVYLLVLFESKENVGDFNTELQKTYINTNHHISKLQCQLAHKKHIHYYQQTNEQIIRCSRSFYTDIFPLKIFHRSPDTRVR